MLRLSRQRDVTGKPIPLHDAEGFEGMRRAGRLAAATLEHIAGFVRPGVSTAELDRLCEDFMRAGGAVPATIGYHGYRHASCISVNHVVTHGIPSADKILQPGDILNIDVTPCLDGWHGDSSRMYVVGEPSVKARRLIEATREALAAGIAAVRDFCGHGVGRAMHQAPQVLHYGRPGQGLVLEPGLFFTIEPMLNAGGAAVKILDDGWTTVTRDRSLSAQFEHSVGVTETGVEIFTLP